MSKRFTATEKWDDPWFCTLSAEDKLFWFYLLDKCDHAGIWQANWLLASFHIPGIQPKTGFHGRVIILKDDKWFIPKFVEFQYGTLDPNNRAHNSVIRILQKEGAYKALTTPLQGRKDMDKDMVKEPFPSPLKSPEFVLPDWIDTVTWTAYLDIRKRKKAASTAHALNLIVAALEKLNRQGHDPKRVLEASIIGGWTGVFPLKSGFTPNREISSIEKEAAESQRIREAEMRAKNAK